MLTVDHFLNLEKELNGLIAQRDYILQKKADVIQKVGSAKARLGLEDEVKEVLERLQYDFYSRNLKDIEVMLTAMMRETLPQIQNAKIKLDLYNKAGVSALDIYLEKETPASVIVSDKTKKSKKADEPLLEDVYEDNGGALVNVISVGAQFIALANTDQRRFLSLDEPDCWIKPDRILDFSSIISQVAKKSGFQVLYVSHHTLDHFASQANIVKLYRKNESQLAFEHIHIADEWNDETTPGIRAIELINFKSHEHTFLKMYPGVNYVIGENNLGKSVISSAIRAVAYNESKDTCIRHWFDDKGVKHIADKAQVILYLENNQKLIWTRSKKGSPKVQYELQSPNQTQTKIEDGEKSKIIDWVKDLLGIYPTDDLDIQLVNQKKSVFLLDEKSTTKAKILSVGQEQLYVQEGQEKYKQLVREDKRIVKEGEDFLFKLTTQLEKFELLLLQVNKELVQEFAKLIASIQGHTKLAQWIQYLQYDTQLSHFESIQCEQPTLKNTIELQKWLSMYFYLQKLNFVIPSVSIPAFTDQTQLVNKMQFLSKINELKKEGVSIPKLVELVSQDKLTNFLIYLEYTVKLLSLNDNLVFIEKMPTITDSSLVLESGKKLKEIEDTSTKMNKEIEEKKKHVAMISKEKEHFIHHILHNHCPLCLADKFEERVK